VTWTRIDFHSLSGLGRFGRITLLAVAGNVQRP
jgi:hypothetical protein